MADLSKFSLRRRFKTVTVTIEQETYQEISVLANKFENLTRTDIMRFAIEWALQSKEFKQVLSELNT